MLVTDNPSAESRPYGIAAFSPDAHPYDLPPAYEQTPLYRSAEPTPPPYKDVTRKTPAAEVEAQEVEVISSEHHSNLASLLTPFLTFNKDELIELKADYESAKQQFSTLKKDLKTKSNTLIESEKKLKKAQKHKNTGEAQNLTKKIVTLKKEISQLTPPYDDSKKKLATAHSDLKQAKMNTNSLVKFSVQFLTSLRGIQSLKNKGVPDSDPRIKKLQSFSVKKLVIDKPDGRIHISDLKLQLKTLRFEKNSEGHQIPVFGIERVQAKVAIDLPEGESLKLNLDMKDLDITIDSNIGRTVYNYVSSSNIVWAGLKSAGRSIMGRIENIPGYIKVSGRQANIQLDELKAATVVSLANQAQSTPDSLPDLIFESLGFKVSAELASVSVRTTGELDTKLGIQQAKVDYDPEPVKKKQSIHRKTLLSCSLCQCRSQQGITIC